MPSKNSLNGVNDVFPSSSLDRTYSAIDLCPLPDALFGLPMSAEFLLGIAFGVTFYTGLLGLWLFFMDRP